LLHCHVVINFDLFCYFYSILDVRFLLVLEFVLMYSVVDRGIALSCSDERLDIFTDLPAYFVMAFLAHGLLIL
jgi:hypothetical protein